MLWERSMTAPAIHRLLGRRARIGSTVGPRTGIVSRIFGVRAKRPATRVAGHCRGLWRCGALLHPVEQHRDAIETAWNRSRGNCTAVAVYGIARTGESMSGLRNHVKPPKLVDRGASQLA